MPPQAKPTREDAAAARAHRRKKGRGRGVSIARLRLADLQRIFAHRYGPMLPDDDAGREDAFIAAQHVALLTHGAPQAIASWMARWAPWMSRDEITGLTDAVIARPRRWRADTLAQKLNLHEALRAALRITTIGAVDLPKDERDKRDRERRRAAQQARRRSRGVIARQSNRSKARSHGRRKA